MDGKEEKTKGILYLCATPIGNMEDITYRVVRILQEADLIAAEDTRNSRKILEHYDIKTPMISYHEHNKYDRGQEITDMIKQGKRVALVTDAGTPGISDPGEELVRQCKDEGLEVTSLPGASAFVTALSMSGQSCKRCCFEAFLPRDGKERKDILQELSNEKRTIVLYEAPHRLKRTLLDLFEVLGDRGLSICRELTKVHEEVVKTTLKKAVEIYETKEPKGEYVLVIAGKSKEEENAEKRKKWEGMSIDEHVKYYTQKGIDKKEAMRLVASDRGVSKRDIYQALIKNTEQN